MKHTFFASTTAAFFLSALPAVAQVTSPLKPTPAPTRSTPATAAVSPAPDGIVFYNGQAYLVRKGRALVIDEKLVPKGQILTFDGKFVSIPSTYTDFPEVIAPKKGTPQQTRIGEPGISKAVRRDPTQGNGPPVGGRGLRRE